MAVRADDPDGAGAEGAADEPLHDPVDEQQAIEPSGDEGGDAACWAHRPSENGY